MLSRVIANETPLQATHSWACCKRHQEQQLLRNHSWLHYSVWTLSRYSLLYIDFNPLRISVHIYFPGNYAMKYILQRIPAYSLLFYINDFYSLIILYFVILSIVTQVVPTSNILKAPLPSVNVVSTTCSMTLLFHYRQSTVPEFLFPNIGNRQRA